MLKNTLWFLSGASFMCVIAPLICKFVYSNQRLQAAADFYKK